MRRHLVVLAFAALAACDAPRGTTALFDLDAPTGDQARFYDLPYPSDLRLGAGGGPDLSGFPNVKALPLVADLLKIGGERPGFPVIPVGYVRFDAALAPRSLDEVLPAAPASPVLLVDVDPASPERGRLFPVVATVPEPDDYLPPGVLAMAARPGFVLAGGRTYAFVVRRDLGDATGARLDVPPALADLAAGRTPPGARGEAAAALYAPLWPVLADLGIPADEVAAATVFTTGDVVADLAALSDQVLARFTAAIADLAVDPDDGATNPRFCELHGTVTFPQFQVGVPPFNTEGLFRLGSDGVPEKQRDETVPLVITLPLGEMPAGGWPLALYFHGSGGLSTQAVDRGPNLPGGGEKKGEGPAFVLAAHGLATAASALPVNPERLPNADETAYLNVQNLAAFRDTFRQGVLEQRLLLAALRELRIPPATVAACAGLSLPGGETAYRFSDGNLVATGQSMGGMYTNMIGAVEPRIRAVVPTGAGGYWGYFILQTSLIENAATLLATLLDSGPLTFVHPTMALLETSWEAAEPFVYMPRLGSRPLPGHPVRPVYEPVGKDDSYFPTTLFDAIAVSYDHQQAGEEVWPTMQEVLRLAGLDGILPYPVKQNRTSADGTPFTGVVVQYAPPPGGNGHSIYANVDAVKYQYGCFLESFLATGVATVPAPAPLGTPCPR